MSAGYVYVIRAEGGDGPVKIGWSADPQDRVKQLQTGSPVILRLLAEHEGPTELEAFLHEHFREWRLHGEWFQLEDPVTQVAEAVPLWSGALRREVGSAYAFDGPHARMSVRLGRALASGASGLTDKEYRVAFWYMMSPGETRKTQVEIAEVLGVHPDTLGRIISVLLDAEILIQDGVLGRTKFYCCNPHLSHVGSKSEHQQATSECPPPRTRVRIG